jgi:hypothetical protein
MRPQQLGLRCAAAFAAGALLAAACSGGGGDDGASPTSGAEIAAPVVAVELAPPDAFGVGNRAVIPPGVGMEVVAAANRFVQDGMVDPLVGAEPSEEFAALFSPDVQPLVVPGGRDRGALADDGAPVATESPSVTTSPVELDVLLAADSSAVLAVAAFRARTNATTEQGPVQIGRTVELTFEPVDGAWRITAYRVNATRKGIGPEPTTTTATSEDGA